MTIVIVYVIIIYVSRQLLRVFGVQMAKIQSVFRAFISNPSDLDNERRQIEDAINLINPLFTEYGVKIEPVTWKKNVTPGISSDPQAVINEQIPRDYDLFIGMLWTRFGTPTPRASSGTEEEFSDAYNRWKRDPKCIELIFYFKETSLPPKNIIPEQLEKITRFRTDIGAKGLLYDTFKTSKEFYQKVYCHLTSFLLKHIKLMAYGQITLVDNINSDVTLPQLIGNISSPAKEEDLTYIVNTITGSSKIGVESLNRITEALNKQNTFVDKETAELKTITDNEFAKQLGIALSLNRIARHMTEFNNLFFKELPIFNMGLHTFLNAYGHLLSIFPASDREQKGKFDLQKPLKVLIATMKESNKQYGSLPKSISNLPSHHGRLEKAKQEQIRGVNIFVDITNSAIRLAETISRIYDNLYEDSCAHEKRRVKYSK